MGTIQRLQGIQGAKVLGTRADMKPLTLDSKSSCKLSVERHGDFLSALINGTINVGLEEKKITNIYD